MTTAASGQNASTTAGRQLTVTDNDIQFNAGYGILLQSDTRDRVGGNRCEHNGRKSRITGPTVFRQ